MMRTVTITFQADTYSPWMISNYIDRFSSLITNIAIAKEITLALLQGISPEMISIGTKSYDIWDPKNNKSLKRTMKEQTSLILENDKKPNQLFFSSLLKIKRPLLIVERNDLIEGLAGYNTQIIRLLSASFNSPGDLTFSVDIGLAKLLNEIRFGKNRELREQEMHETNLKTIELENLKHQMDMIESALKIYMGYDLLLESNSELAPVILDTIKSTINSLDHLNEKAGVKYISVDF